jgi:membrane protein
MGDDPLNLKMTSRIDALKLTAESARRILAESLKSFARDNHIAFAASLALYGFFALMPLLLLLMIVLSHIFSSSQAAIELLGELTHDLFPHFTDAILNDITKLSRQSLGGMVSVFLLAWSVTPLAAGLRQALLRMFKIESRRHFITTKLLDVTAVLALLVILISGVLVRLAVGYWANDLPGGGLLQSIIGGGLPFLLTVVAIAFIYRVFAPVRPRRDALWIGAFSATLLLFILRPMFLMILRFNPQYGFAFGSLKTIFLIIVWVYYSFAVLILGAEIMAHAHRREVLLLRSLFAPGASIAFANHPLLDPFLSIHPPQETLFAENDPGDSMFYVLAGEIRLTLHGAPLKTLGPGDYFGEMSLLLNTPRSATASTGPGGARLVRITPQNLDAILRENPAIVRSLLVEMAHRLKQSNDARPFPPAVSN